jgi:hypothetical protein
MTATPTALEVLDREFLVLRGRILEVAATLDRIARAAGSVEADPRFQQVCEGLQLLAGREPATDRTDRVQLVFSLPYDPHWRAQGAARGKGQGQK